MLTGLCSRSQEDLTLAVTKQAHSVDQESLHPLPVAATFLGALLALITLWSASPRNDSVLVVSNPFDPPGRALSIIGEAGGSFVGNGRVPWLSIAYSSEPGFASRLVRAGALFALSNPFSATCLQEAVK